MKIVKKALAVILAMLMVVGIYLVSTDADEVQATSATETIETGAVVLGTDQLVSTTIGVNLTPVPSATTYKDYLFAGWFTSQDCSLETAVTDKTSVTLTECYAKFVPKDTLSVKVQTANYKVKEQIDENTEVVAEYGAIRFISSVESLDYTQVGFRVNGKDYPMDKTVYERIESNVTKEDSTEKVTYEFSPKVVGTKSEYFITAKMAVAEADVEKNHTVQAFWTTLDGITVYGDARCINVADNENVDINVPLSTNLTGTGYTVTYGGKAVLGYEILNVLDEEGEVDTTQPSTLRVTLPVALETLPSATEILVKSGDDTVASAVYRNYYTEYTGDNVGDTTWYTVNTSAREFIIASPADLYGLANIVNEKTDTTYFANDTIYMIRDIVINEDINNPTYEWNRIGNNQIAFAGTFNGDNNKISGVSDLTFLTGGSNGQASGLFGNLAYTGKLENFTLDDSKFVFNDPDTSDSVSYNNNAAIVGYNQGDLENIYVGKNVTISTNVSGVGGLVGMNSLTSATYTTNNIKNCWFAGTITGTTGAIGGIVGWTYKGPVAIENCLNTGTIISAGKGTAGGILGQASGATPANVTTITKCINTGTVKSANTQKAGSVIGYVNNATVNMADVYTTDKRECTTSGSSFSTTRSMNGIGTCSTSNVVINGQCIIDTTEETLTGMNAYLNTDFDFYSNDNPAGVWAVVDSATPVLKKFATGDITKTLTGTRSSQGWYNEAYVMNSSYVMELSEAATFELDSVADLNGFAQMTNNTSNGEQFASDVVVLTADIELNPGWIPQVNENGVLQNKPSNTWTPIGNNSNSASQFKGTFDGQENTISGIYVDMTVRDAGLFGITATSAQIKNLTVTDSYITTTENWSGGVAGVFRGTLMDKIYVSETVYVKGEGSVGGVVGMLSHNDATRTISNCCFAGKLYASGTQVGGILGRSQNCKLNNTITNCLFTGNIVSTYTDTEDVCVGGIVGDASEAPATNVNDCLAVGTVKVSKSAYVDSAVGKVNATNTTITDVFTTHNISHLTDAEVTFTTSNGTIVDDTELKTDASVAIPNLFKMSDGTTENATDNTAWVNVPGSYPVLSWTIAED